MILESNILQIKLKNLKLNIVTAPFVAMFLAAVFNNTEMVQRIGEAFVILQHEVPEQYWTLLLIAFGASFGVKGIIKGAKTFVDGKK